MCGIAGLVEAETRDRADTLRLATRMREAMGHRGPDGWGLLELVDDEALAHSAAGVSRATRTRGGSNVWLGHQRLAIIDLTDAAAQPARASDGSGWLVFNGEIYNFRDLQQQHRVAPHAASDAIVLLELLTARGMEILPELRGMFAFAYWSERERALYLARDRFGIKPLYYARPSQRALAFASEPRALAAAGLAGPLDPAIDATFLRRGHVPLDDSAYDALDVVAPGTVLRFDGRQHTTTQWATLEDALGDRSPQPVDQAARIFQDALDDSVRAHLVSDVPVGLFLSGGLDSAALVASAARAGGGPLRTFTVIVPGSAIDESAPARAIAERFGASHTEVEIARAELGSLIEEALAVMAEPTVDGLNTFIVSKAVARAGVKVVLSGLGGDEMLGGYPSFRDVPILWRATAAFRAGLPGAATAARLARLMPIAAPGKLAEMIAHPARTREGLWRQYRSLFQREQIGALTGTQPRPDDEQPAIGSEHPMLDVVMLCELREYMAPQLLRDSDAFSMCSSLELRVPFVDHLLMSRVHERGWWSRGRHRTHKAAIFAAMPSPLPADHLARRKTGFVLPIGEWLRAALNGDADLAALRAPLATPAMQPYVAAFRAGTLHPHRLWALAVRERFREIHPG